MYVFHLYGLVIGIGIWAALYLSQKAQNILAKQEPRYSLVNLESLLLWVVLPGIIGARLYHVTDYWGYYSGNLPDIVKLWQGGLGIYGALIGGVLGVSGYTWVAAKKGSLLAALDLIVFGLPLAQAIGRLGNFFNQELFGLPTTLPWAVFISYQNRPVAYQAFSWFHPLFAYEALLNVVLLGSLWLLLKKQSEETSGGVETHCNASLPTGTYFGIYLIGYGVIRFWLDFLRINPWKLGVLTTAQWISLLFIGCSLSVLVLQFSKRK